MGDVLTHLERHQDVSTLLRDCFAALKPKGQAGADLPRLSQELAGLDRFIPVQSDADRVMVCVLEYEPRTVLVHDLIHTRSGERLEAGQKLLSQTAPGAQGCDAAIARAWLRHQLRRTRGPHVGHQRSKTLTWVKDFHRTLAY